MDPSGLVGKAPTTTDPITWIAFLLVVVLVLVLLWQLRTAGEDRRADSASRDAALKAFRDDLAAQRAHDDAQVNKTHDRIDGLSGEVRALSREVAARAA